MLRWLPVVAMLVLVGSTDAHASHVIVRRYTTGATDPVVAAVVWTATRVDVVRCSADDHGAGIGGVCFDPPGAAAVEVRVADISGQRVSGTVRFESSDGRRLRSATFCEDVVVPVPAGAVRGVVTLDTTVLRCWPDRGGPATAGTVTVVEAS